MIKSMSKTYEISNLSSGQSLGRYEAEDAEGALLAMWQDASAAGEPEPVEWRLVGRKARECSGELVIVEQ